ncbi:1-acyl-sn-glycerol-3-phosphate acyltransferase [Vitreimonas flagellata]|uniref:1-acyl-sn-glycerol-3-phosphate acyltransferase n=1 Tax=Vitreimonas flagellata TaxID=2560861 RepID=UPI0010750E2D|nr:1-acyl-sn-glycerol-3-phosphate acyltransferase [Vitreimonas flagellata]
MSETLIDGSTARPAPYSGLGSEIVRWLSSAYLTLAGWKVRGDWPGVDKAVLVAAPHTSNWDGLNMLATAGFYRVKLAWMGKKSLTQGPFGWVLKAMGCVPIDRSQSNDVVNVMREAFARRARLILAIPPEGTRTLAREWKSGFYHIAHGAGVPLVISVLDYGTKTVSLAAVIEPSGDYAADLALIRAHYVGVKGKHAEKFAA